MMARSKGPGQPRRRHTIAEGSKTEEYSSEKTSSDEEVAPTAAKAAVVAKAAKKRKTEQLVPAEVKKRWADSLHARGFRCERQVDIQSLGTESHGIPQITNRGLHFWFLPLVGYKKSVVIEFYKTMNPQVDFTQPQNDKITANVGGKKILITPGAIAEYLDYPRPNSENTNYPRAVDNPIDSGDVRRAIYLDHTQFRGTNQPGLFKEDYRLVSKVMHYNLFPRGSEHRPTDKSMEVLYVFMNNDFVCDRASWIFYQIIDAKLDSTVKLKLPFPCMITSLCRRQGVKVLNKEYTMSNPGPINGASLSKSVKLSRASLASIPSSVAPQPVATPPEGPPSFNSRVEAWMKKLFCQNAMLLKEVKMAKKERKKDRKEIHKLRAEMAWHTGHLESTSGTKYMPPAKEESEEEVDEVVDGTNGSPTF